MDTEVKDDPKNLHGKQFEKMVHDQFKDLHRSRKLEWERVIDSAAAGNIIGKAKRDFRLTLEGGERGRPWVFCMEMKASIKFSSLGENIRLIKPHQSANMRLATRAGMIGLYLFHSVNNSEIEVWSSVVIDKHYQTQRKKFIGRPALVIGTPNLPTLVTRWVTDPHWLLDELAKSEKASGV